MPDSHGNMFNLQPGRNKNSSMIAKEIRNKFAEYFITDGAVEWQNSRL